MGMKDSQVGEMGEQSIACGTRRGFSHTSHPIVNLLTKLQNKRENEMFFL